MTSEVVSVAKHLDVAGRFYALGDSSRSAGQSDAVAWSIVLAFYAAVHWVRGYIRFKSPEAQIASHDDIRRCFDDYPELRKVKVSYDTLKQASQAVRYYGELAHQQKDVDSYFQLARQVRDWAVPKCKSA